MAAKVWTLPATRAKNNRQHVIPLSEQALGILGNISGGGGQVFEPVSFSREKAQLDAELNQGATNKSPPWTLHDLRRTAASSIASVGTAPHVIEAVLNHRSGVIRGVAAVYNRCRYEPEKRVALDLWGAVSATTGPADRFLPSQVLSPGHMRLLKGRFPRALHVRVRLLNSLAQGYTSQECRGFVPAKRAK